MSYEIKVGNVYLNSVGQRCEIIAISQDEGIRYKLSNGNTYTTSQNNILRRWKLQKENQMNIQPKYKPGDKVRVRADLSPSIDYKMENSDATDTAVGRMLKYKGKVVTIEEINKLTKKYILKETGGHWTDEMFEGLAEEISQKSKTADIPKYLDRPPQAGDYVERVSDIAFFLADRNPSVICKVESTDSGDTVRINGKLYHSKRFKVLNPIHPEYPQSHKQINMPVEATEPSSPEQKSNQKMETQMKKLDLVLLFQFLATQATEKVDATNAKHIGILIDSEDSYVGYVYANTIKELQDIVRKPENEGRKLHIFDYSQTLAQKPRPVAKVARV